MYYIVQKTNNFYLLTNGDEALSSFSEEVLAIFTSAAMKHKFHVANV